MKRRKRGIRRMFAGAMAVLMVLSAVNVSGWGVMNAKAEETAVGKNPKYLSIGSTQIIDNGQLQDDGVSGNDTAIYQGTNWYYDSTKNQLVLDGASISDNITNMDGNLAIILSGTNTMRMIQSGLNDGQIEQTLEINGSNYNGSLSCGTISTVRRKSTNSNLNIIGATLETSKIDCEGSVTIENSHVVANDTDNPDLICGDNINIVDSYVEAKATTERHEDEVIKSNQQINVSGSQIVVSRALACQKPVLSDCNFSNSVITKQWKDYQTKVNVTKTSVYGTATLKENLTIASGESIEFESGASITNPEKLTLEDGASLLVDGAEHTHNKDGDITYTWKNDNKHIKNVACKDCPIGYVTNETESHSIGENGFCACNNAYQPADLTTNKYDIDGDKINDEVYEISNAGQLYWFAGLVNGTLSGVTQNASANAVLTKDIVVNEDVLKSDGTVNEGTFKEWTPIADCMEGHTTQYSGTFDGNNKTVSGLYLNGNSARIGLFGSSEADGNIKNVGVVDSYFKGNDFVGGVCGRNDGTITNCYNAGNLTAIDPTAAIGGICGYNGNGGTIANCYNTGTVTAAGAVASVGGVCGCSLAPISNCYNIGTVTATSSGADISGICGYYFGPVTNCYYLADTEDENGGKTVAQFASGEIAYLLSQGCTVGGGEGENAVTYSGSVWGQALGGNGDTYPVLKKAGDVENTVYRNETYQGCEGNKGELVYSYSNTQEAPVYAEHIDEDLDGKCDICKLDLKTFKQLGLLIAKVNKNLSDGKYADVQYTTASIDNLRTALVAAGAVTEASSDTDIATAFDKLLAASTVGAGGLIKADHNIVILFADEGAQRGIASGNGWYANGETVTLTVTPSVGYSFGKWTKDKAGSTSVGTESAYTFTLGNDSPDAYYAWLDKVKYTVTCESVEGGTGIASEEQYVYGQKATVTATANDNYEFVGWKDSYGTTVSTDAAYNFTVIGDATLKPEFVKVKTEEGAAISYVTVSFYHQSGKLLDSQKVVSGEGKITTTVNAPTKVGFDFLGWSAKASGATAEDVVDFETATFSENTSLYPVFKAQDITYTLKVGSQTEQKAPQSSVTVTADSMEGKQFVGWKDANGNIVSYDSTYTFIITGDTTLEACYEQVDSEVVKEPTIIIGEPTYEDITGGYKMAFYFNYTVPEDCKLVDIGIIRKKGDHKADGITLETDGISQYSVLSKLGSEGQFYYTKSNYYGTGHTVTGYMIYEKNGIRYTVYSDSMYGVKNN